MANPKSKVLPKLFNIFVFVFLAHCADTFAYFLESDRTVLGTAMFGHVGGVAIIIVACAIYKRDFRYYGLNFKRKKLFRGFYLGALFSCVPLAFFAVIKLFLSLFGIGTFTFRPPTAYAPGNEFGLGKTLLIYAAASVVTVFMFEYVFRGYMLKEARPVYSFSDANIIQAAFCPMFSIATVGKYFLYGYYGGDLIHNIIIVVSSVIFFLLTDFMTGIKRGMLTRVTGNIWAAFFDHFFYRVIGYSIFVCRMKFDLPSIFIYLTLIQATSFVMVYFFYKKEQEKREQKKLESKIRHMEHYNKALQMAENGTVPEEIASAKDPNASKLENYSEGSISERVAAFSDVTKSSRRRSAQDVSVKSTGKHIGVSHRPPRERDNDIVGISEVDVKNFYREYADEITRQREAKHREAQDALETRKSEQKKKKESDE